jgi:cell division protease FtsH
MVMSEDDKKMTAYHEAGHAIVGRSVPDHDPVHKVTIIPRGRALGVTMYLPTEDRYSQSKQYLESLISSLFGGRIAEEIVFGAEKVSTGASSDIQRSTEIARSMVTKWGLSEKLGPLTYMEEEGEVFLGHSVAQNKHVSDETAHIIDEEIRVIVDRNYERSYKILTETRDILENMAAALMKYETIDSNQVDDLMAGKEPRPPSDWIDSDDESNTPTSNGKDSGSKAASKGKESGGDSKIGGPAGEH